MALKELQERAKTLGDRIVPLAKKPDRSAEEEAELDRLMAEGTDLQTKLEREYAIDASAAKADTWRQSTGSVTAAVSPEEARRLRQGPGAGGPSGGGRDHRSIGLRFAESKEAQDWLAMGGPSGIPSAKFAAGDFGQHRLRTAVRYDAGDPPVSPEQLALITGVTLPSFLPPPQVVPGIAAPGPFDLTMRDVIAAGRTGTDTIYYVFLQTHANAAAETAESSAFDPTTLPATAALKPEGSFTFNQASVPVATFAEWVAITKQTSQDAAQVQTFVESVLLVDLQARINSQIANGNGTAPNIRGILQTSGILVLDATYFTANPVRDVGTANENFNRIERAITNLRIGASRARATFVAVNPADYSAMRTSTDSTRQYFGGGPFVDGSPPTVWGLPLVQDTAIPALTALVGQGTKAVFFDREDGTISYGFVNAQLIQNQFTILAEARGALAVIDPGAFAKVTLI